jgi:MraZ protein
MNLQGEYTVAIDPKGRIRLPAGLLRQLGVAVEGEQDQPIHHFVMNHWFENRLMLWPIETWDDMGKKLRGLNPFNKKHRLLQREFYKGQTAISSDATGRILINKKLLEYAGIEGELVMSCQWNRIEISSAKEHNAPFDAQLFEDLGQEVFGGDEDSAVGMTTKIDLGSVFGSDDDENDTDLAQLLN